MLNKEFVYLTEFPQLSCASDKKVELAQLLAEKENRQLRQQQALLNYDSVISLTLVSPGAIKHSALWQYVGQRAISSINYVLENHNIKIEKYDEYHSAAGLHAIWMLNTNGHTIKKFFIDLEESIPIARLWDIDVITRQKCLSRSDFNLSARTCLLCKEPAKICAKTEKHELTDILNIIHKIVKKDYFANNVSNFVYNALIQEVEFTPKPGLVDMHDNGSHTDMNLTTFYISAKILKPYFHKFVLDGIEFAVKNTINDKLLKNLKKTGLQAEIAMFQATNNINTHKGSIFSFGLICGAIGYIFQKKDALTINNISKTVIQIAKNITQELIASDKNNLTAGVNIFRKYSIKGVRGEAEKGFITALTQGFCKEDSLLDTEHKKLKILTRLLAHNEDTNIINRGGIDKLIWLNQYATNILNNPEIVSDKILLKKELVELNKLCIKDNLSPGGSADLFAIILFLHNFFIKK